MCVPLNFFFGLASLVSLPLELVAPS